MDQKHPHGRGEDLKSTKKSAQARETPPRAWGRRAVPALAVAVSGNTPTGVGKTVASAAASGLGRKHPHGRGEDSPCGASSPDRCETPPRAWGRPHAALHSSIKCRNTPTGVGKTGVSWQGVCRNRKHPHGRGEDPFPVASSMPTSETPPRAWGRRGVRRGPRCRLGNTPTGVGKTVVEVIRQEDVRKHPNGRGEDRRW